MQNLFSILAAIIEAPAAVRARRASAAHAQRKAARMQREMQERSEHAARQSLRDRNEYPFHA